MNRVFGQVREKMGRDVIAHQSDDIMYGSCT